jgi:hypothetical protein
METSAAALGVAEIGRGENHGDNDREFARHGRSVL